jgi:hypothetical protein
MGSSPIQSGIEVVREFLDLLSSNTALDPNVVAAIQELQRQGKLTKVRLLQALADQRKETPSW